MTRTNIVLGAVIALLIVLLSLRECSHIKSKEAALLQAQSIDDSLKITRDKLGRVTAKNQAIVTEYQNFINWHFATADSLGRQLKKVVTSHTLAATVATQQVKVQATLPTSQTLRGANPSPAQPKGAGASAVSPPLRDSGDGKTLNPDSCHPVYVLRFDPADPYRKGTITAGADSFKVDIIIPESLTFTTTKSRFNLFRPAIYTSSYTNSNPYVEVTGLRSYAVKCDCGNKSLIWGAIGGGLGFGLGFATRSALK